MVDLDIVHIGSSVPKVRAQYAIPTKVDIHVLTTVSFVDAGFTAQIAKLSESS